MREEHNRVYEAYIQMAQQADHRPNALPVPDPENGSPTTTATLGDTVSLSQEAVDYADVFTEEIEAHSFHIAAPDSSVTRALVFAVEGSRLLAGGRDKRKRAVDLLQMAVDEARLATKGKL